MALSPVRQAAAKTLLNSKAPITKKPVNLGRPKPGAKPISMLPPPKNTSLGKANPAGPINFSSKWGMGARSQFNRQTVKPKRFVRIDPSARRIVQ